MVPFDLSRTVRAEDAPEDRTPRLAQPGITLQVGDHRVRFEVWNAGGEVFLIVRGAVSADSLEACADEIASRARMAWGASVLIIEDWADEVPRYRVMGKAGERVEVDMDAIGLILTRDPSGALIT